jgi:hypothetical protein
MRLHQSGKLCLFDRTAGQNVVKNRLNLSCRHLIVELSIYKLLTLQQSTLIALPALYSAQQA